MLETTARPAGEGLDKLDQRIRIDPPSSSGGQLRFIDQRMFGGLSLSPGGAELPAELAHIGRDPFDPEFDLAGVVRKIRSKRSAIKRVLLDQTVISGIGNIYADEALWRARLHYDRPADALTPAKARELIGHARDVMAEALAQGSTSFGSLYVDVQRLLRLFRALARRLRTRGTAVPALRVGRERPRGGGDLGDGAHEDDPVEFVDRTDHP